MLLDIHTHHVPPVADEGIHNVAPEDFSPLAGACYSVGIHPWSVADGWEGRWPGLEKAARHPSVLALGETGLDKLSPVDFVLQTEVFERHIGLSEEVRKPLVIHCVKAFNELVELKRKHRPSVPWVVHGFRNNLHIARTLWREGLYLSLGEKYQEPVLQEAPLERLLAETDESPAGIRSVVGGMAERLGIPCAELCRRLDENARKVFFSPQEFASSDKESYFCGTK